MSKTINQKKQEQIKELEELVRELKRDNGPEGRIKACVRDLRQIASNIEFIYKDMDLA